MEMLRERIKGLERKIVELLRNGQENLSIADRLHRWTRALLLTHDPAALPRVVVDRLQHEFLIPQAALRLWDVDRSHAAAPFAEPVGDDVRSFVASLLQPYCGVNAGFEAASWLPESASVMSLALIPLRHAEGGGDFGLLVLGSPDPTRYAADMGTEFLAQIGELSSAALARLLPESDL
jgi:uncharacterized protein YigA (DUF484 family)